MQGMTARDCQAIRHESKCRAMQGKGSGSGHHQTGQGVGY